jgi:hypothetical protein
MRRFAQSEHPESSFWGPEQPFFRSRQFVQLFLLLGCLCLVCLPKGSSTPFAGDKDSAEDLGMDSKYAMRPAQVRSDEREVQSGRSRRWVVGGEHARSSAYILAWWLVAHAELTRHSQRGVERKEVQYTYVNLTGVVECRSHCYSVSNEGKARGRPFRKFQSSVNNQPLLSGESTENNYLLGIKGCCTQVRPLTPNADIGKDTLPRFLHRLTSWLYWMMAKDAKVHIEAK